MSIGIGGWCQLIEQDKKTVIYQYGAYNLNDFRYRNEERAEDGMFLIQKGSLIEPEIHRKVKKLFNGKKKEVVKRIVVPVPDQEIYEKGNIQIQNCSNCWQTSIGDKDYIAWCLIKKIFLKYQEEGHLPERVTYDV